MHSIRVSAPGWKVKLGMHRVVFVTDARPEGVSDRGVGIPFPQLVVTVRGGGTGLVAFQSMKRKNIPHP